MTPFEQQTEDMLRARLVSISPPRSLFASVTETVTEVPQYRYISASLWKDIRYQFSFVLNMNKSLVMGAIAVVFVGGGVVWYASTAGQSNTVAVVPAPEAVPVPANAPSASPAESTPALAEAATPAVAPIPSSVSVDTLAADIENGASADAAAVASESGDGNAVSADLTNYSNVKTTSYDNSL